MASLQMKAQEKMYEEGQKVTFDIEQDPKNSKKLRAANVTLA